MRTLSCMKLSAGVVLAAVLTACGGGGDSLVEEDLFPTGLNAAVAVSNATQAELNGIYASSSISLSRVWKFNPVGEQRETCRFKFSDLQQAGTSRIMGGGDIRYIPGTNVLHVTFLAINGVEFTLSGSANAAVDRGNNEVDFNGAVLTSTQGTGATITLTGSIPMLGGRPEGC